MILFGFKSCGKTTLGKMLAVRMNRSFFDTDEMLETLHEGLTGERLPFRQIYIKIGEHAFRRLESNVIQQLKHIQNSIIALGGGLILDPQSAAALAKLGQLVYLKVSKETLKKRILGKQLPAFLDSADPEKAFEQFYNERKTQYEATPALSIDLETKTQDQVVLELSAMILQREDHGQ